MMDLTEIREKIDVIDREMVRLFEARMELCKQVAEYKIQTGKAVQDKERELQKLEALGNLTDNDFNKRCVQELFVQIMSMSKELQQGIVAANRKLNENDGG